MLDERLGSSIPAGPYMAAGRPQQERPTAQQQHRFKWRHVGHAGLRAGQHMGLQRRTRQHRSTTQTTALVTRQLV